MQTNVLVYVVVSVNVGLNQDFENDEDAIVAALQEDDLPGEFTGEIVRYEVRREPTGDLISYLDPDFAQEFLFRLRLSTIQRMKWLPR